MSEATTKSIAGFISEQGQVEKHLIYAEFDLVRKAVIDDALEELVAKAVIITNGTGIYAPARAKSDELDDESDSTAQRSGGKTIRQEITELFRRKHRWSVKELKRALPHRDDPRIYAGLSSEATKGRLRRIQQGVYELAVPEEEKSFVWRDRTLAPSARVSAFLQSQGPLPEDAIAEILTDIKPLGQVLLDMMRAEQLWLIQQTNCYTVVNPDVKKMPLKNSNETGTELKPCPFCGCKEIIIDEEGSEYCVVRCGNCEAMVTCPSHFVKPMYTQETIKQWNARCLT